jgi:hypothetical protein
MNVQKISFDHIKKKPSHYDHVSNLHEEQEKNDINSYITIKLN